MKLAAQVRRAPGDSLASRIECLAQAGFEAVEVHTDALEQLGEYQAALRSVGIPALSMCPAGPDFDLVRDEFSQQRRINNIRKALDSCNALGIKAFISVPVRGGLPQGISVNDEIESYVRALEQLAPHAEAAGVTIVVEPLNRYETHLVNTVSDGIAIAERIGSPCIKVLADTFHMSIEEDDLGTSILAASQWIAHVHLADNQRAPPGPGMLDFPTVFSALHKIGYDGSMALECRLRGDPSTALHETNRYLRTARTSS